MMWSASFAGSWPASSIERPAECFDVESSESHGEGELK